MIKLKKTPCFIG